MKLYRHYKGDLYVEVARGLLESVLPAECEMVTYRQCKSDRYFVRPACEFDGEVSYQDPVSPARVKTITVKRFKFVGNC